MWSQPPKGGSSLPSVPLAHKTASDSHRFDSTTVLTFVDKHVYNKLSKTRSVAPPYRLQFLTTARPYLFWIRHLLPLVLSPWTLPRRRDDDDERRFHFLLATRSRTLFVPPYP